MCLLADTQKAQRVKRSITCYKSVFYDKEYAVFRSAFQDFEYKLGRAYYEPKFKREVPQCMVSHGFHSHARKGVAEDESGSWYANAMLECRIPAGAMYYKGDAGYTTDFCSDIIVITAWKYPQEEEWHRVRTGIVIKPFLLRALDRLKKRVRGIMDSRRSRGEE